MILRLTCPECKYQFTIELTKAQREIDRLKSELAAIRRGMDEMRALGGLMDIFGSDECRR